jgi:superoxide dismutase, Cu-Zn family
MRNRTWLAMVAILAVMLIGYEYQRALSQQRAAQAAERAARAAADRAATAAGAKQWDMTGITMAIAMVEGLGEHKVKGKVIFTQKEDGVEISAELTGLQPGEHGFHVHEFGDCSMADGKCAGAHFNPDKKDHGSPDSANRHVGDLGNIKAGSTGEASYKRVDKMISLNGPHSIIGRSVIVHAKADDFKTVTSAGDRIGCGVIGIADPKMQR